MKAETIDTREFKRLLRISLGDGQDQANAYFKLTLLEAIRISNGDFSADLPKHVASIGTEILGETQAGVVIAECSDVLARQVEQSPT